MKHFALAALLLPSLFAQPQPLPSQKPAPERQRLAVHTETDEDSDDPKGRAEWERTRRWPYGEELPSERYVAAKKHIAKMKKSNNRLAKSASAAADLPKEDTTGWKELGPGNIGGRTRALLVNPDNPNIMYAAGVSGGIWKTTDAGKNWSVLTDMLSNLTVTTMAMDPNDPQTIYAGTGEYWASVARGVGIFKTTDGGDSWTYLESTAVSRFNYMHKLWISPADSQRIYAATWAGVMRSLDGGDSWSLVVNRTGPNLGCSDLTGRADGGSDVIIAACLGPSASPAGTVVRNETAERNNAWETVLTVPNMYRMTLATAPSNPDTVYLMGTYPNSAATPTDRAFAFMGLYRSTERGARNTWELRASGTGNDRLVNALLSNPRENFADVCTTGGTTSWINQGNYDQALAVDPTDPNRVWVGGIDLFRSDDGGKTFGMASYWQAAKTAPAYAHADQHTIVFHPRYDGKGNTTVFFGNDGGLFRTDKALAAVATGARAACATTNSSVVFTNLNNNYAVTQFHTGSVYPGGHTYFGGTQDNGTPAGLDGAGKLGWFSLSGGDGGNGGVNPKDVNVLYVSSQRNTTGNWLLRSDDNGYTYRSVMTGITGPFTSANFLFFAPTVLDPNEPDRLYLGGKILWRTENKGARWTAASAPVPNGVISAIAVHPSNPNRVLLGTNQGWIHYSNAALSTNSETDWDRSQPRFGNVSDIRFDPQNPDVAYAVYSTFNSDPDIGHVFKTTDGGATWTAIDGDLPDVPFVSVAVHPQDANTIYAGSDMGLFVTNDSGSTWAFDPSLPSVPVYSLQFAENNGPVLFAFTYGRGLFRQRLTGDPPCTYALTGGTSVPAYGGTVTNTLNTGSGCPWSGFSISGSFFTMPVSVGTGPGRLSFASTINDGTTTRSAAFQIGSAIHTVTQARPEFPALATASSGATSITVPYVSVQDTRPAAVNADNPVHSCTGTRDAKSTWFRYTANGTGKISIGARGARYDNGLNLGVVVAVYARTAAGEPGAELACTAQTTATGSSVYTNVSVTPTAGQQLLIQVSGRGADSPGGYTVLAVNQ